MISFDYLTLKAFLQENKEFFIGARLQKIQQPTRRDFLLAIRGYQETRKLYINIDPQVYHLCFITDETYLKRNIIIPKKPPMFCMLLRKYLEGFRICEVKIPEYERIFEIYFEAYNELNEKITLCLAVELMGKYSNIILYNTDTNIIIGCAHNVGPEKSKDRELAGTLPYVYPLAQGKADILDFNGVLNYRVLNQNFKGISLSLQNSFEKNNTPLSQIKNYMNLSLPLTPASNKKEYSLYSELIEYTKIYKTVNEVIDDYYSDIQEKIIKKALRLKLKNIVSPRYKKLLSSYEKINNQLKKKDKASKYKKYADLIMANLYNISQFEKNVKLSDWDSGEIVSIPMNTDLTPQENAQGYYNMYSKSKLSVEKLNTLKVEYEDSIAYLEQILYSINTSDTLPDLYDILSECEEAGFIHSKEGMVSSKSVIVEAVEINGYKIYIGKNNKQNDYIVSKIASPNDYWFHVHNCPGSHVLLKTEGKNKPDEKIIIECCSLAKKYSNAANDTKAGVIYTLRKNLKKPPKSNLGYVTYKNEVEIVV